MLKTGMIISDRYEIIDKVGSGGMADVYKAKDQRLNRFVAIKVLKPEYSSDKSFVNKFRGEAQSAAGLSHPNIVNVYDVGDDSGLHYIVMELVEGITLKRFIERKGKLEVKEAVGIAIQIAQGMEAAHDNHIIHRDIKPQNIIISRDGKVKVTDFGIAKATNSNTITSNAMGSVHYLSPEQARGGYSDEKSDIYSLGVTLYEMLSGKVPFAGDNTVSVALLHIQGEAMPLRELDPVIPISVDKIVLKCMQKRPERRYHSASELIADLKKALTNPDGDFVQIPAFVASDSPTINISDELGKIKNSSNYQSDDMRLTKNLAPGKASDEDEEELDTVDSKVEKVFLVGTIITIVILALAIIGIVLWLILPKGPKEPGNTSGNITVSVAPTQGATDEPTATPTVSSDNYYDVPDVTGLTKDDAINAIKDKDPNADPRYTYEPSDTVPAEQVISQYPNKGNSAPYGSIVSLTISSGPEAVVVPDVYGLTQAQADTKLTEKGLKQTHEFVFDDTVESGKVVSTTPERGAPAKSGDTVTVNVSKGPENVVTSVQVPNLTGLTLDDATTTLAQYGLVIDHTDYQSSDTYPQGQVCYQNYSVGETVDKGTKIDVIVSTGPEVKKVTYSGSLTITQNPFDYLADGQTADVVIEMQQPGFDPQVIEEGLMSKDDFPNTWDDIVGDSADPGTVTMSIDGVPFTLPGDTDPVTWTVNFTAVQD